MDLDCGLWVYMKLWEKTPLGYICIRCRTDDAGQLDFLMGIGRLVQVKRFGQSVIDVCWFDKMCTYKEVAQPARITMCVRLSICPSSFSKKAYNS